MIIDVENSKKQLFFYRSFARNHQNTPKIKKIKKSNNRHFFGQYVQNNIYKFGDNE